MRNCLAAATLQTPMHVRVQVRVRVRRTFCQSKKFHPAVVLQTQTTHWQHLLVATWVAQRQLKVQLAQMQWVKAHRQRLSKRRPSCRSLQRALNHCGSWQAHTRRDHHLQSENQQKQHLWQPKQQKPSLLKNKSKRNPTNQRMHQKAMYPFLLLTTIHWMMGTRSQQAACALPQWSWWSQLPRSGPEQSPASLF
jgi:hypothetical protein